MTRDIEVLKQWLQIAVLIAAACTTAVPIIYSFSPWRAKRIGQLFMLQALSFAAAMDLSALFSVWQPKDVLIIFWVDVIVITAIAGSTSALAVLIWRMSHPREKDNDYVVK